MVSRDFLKLTHIILPLFFYCWGQYALHSLGPILFYETAVWSWAMISSRASFITRNVHRSLSWSVDVWWLTVWICECLGEQEWLCSPLMLRLCTGRCQLWGNHEECVFPNHWTFHHCYWFSPVLIDVGDSETLMHMLSVKEFIMSWRLELFTHMKYDKKRLSGDSIISGRSPGLWVGDPGFGSSSVISRQSDQAHTWGLGVLPWETKG